MDAQQQDINAQMELPDADEAPPEYRKGRIASGSGGRPKNNAQNDASRRNIWDIQSVLPSGGAAARRGNSRKARHAAPANESSGIMERLYSLCSLTPKRSFAMSNSQEPIHKRQNDTNTSLPEDFHERNDRTQQMSMSQNDITELRQRFQQALESKEREWGAIEATYKQRLHSQTARSVIQTDGICALATNR
jgi:hypothetical protein